mmetsp:Transcript_57370/g.152976  ORF Transcript_57370/g.152976 Transcript_57370/m.152976 type:complete len:218 (+) Transcript_57370:698-1351(+)
MCIGATTLRLFLGTCGHNSSRNNVRIEGISEIGRLFAKSLTRNEEWGPMAVWSVRLFGNIVRWFGRWSTYIVVRSCKTPSSQKRKEDVLMGSNNTSIIMVGTSQSSPRNFVTSRSVRSPTCSGVSRRPNATACVNHGSWSSQSNPRLVMFSPSPKRCPDSSASISCMDLNDAPYSTRSFTARWCLCLNASSKGVTPFPSVILCWASASSNRLTASCP